VPRIQIPNEFDPRDYQRRAMAYFDNGGSKAITIWHRRAGKDLAAAHQICKAMHQEKGLYWHIFPTAEQARKALWTGSLSDNRRFMEAVFPKAIRKAPREWSLQGEMVVELKCGSVYRLMGSDKMEIVGAGPKGVVFSEFALAKPTTWDLVRPMLRESGGWAWMITTPRGKNHAHKLYEQAGQQDSGWYRDLKTVRDTGLTYFSSKGRGRINWETLIAEERAEGMPESLIEQEYFCSFSAANVGSFYGLYLAQLEARGAVGAHFDSSGDMVFTSWDLGKADDTAIWWWRLREGSTEDNPRVDVLDHYACHGEDIEHYLAVLEERAMKHNWVYERHWLPHDARAKRLGTKQTVYEQFVYKYGSGKVGITPELSLLDGISALRRLLQKDIRFHARCSEVAHPRDHDGVEALRAYHRTWDVEKKAFSETPVHDWSSHSCFVGATPIRTSRGEVPIEEVTAGDRVWLASGEDGLVTAAGMVGERETALVTFSDGRTLECTVDHGFFTTRGLVCADALRYGDGVSTPEDPRWDMSHLIGSTMGLRAAFTESIEASGIGGGRTAMPTCRSEAALGSFAYCTANSTQTEPVPSRRTTVSSQLIGTGTTLQPPIGHASRGRDGTRRQPNTGSRNSTASGTTGSRADTTRPRTKTAASTCIAQSGARRMAPFRRVTTFITRTATRPITGLRIWNSCRPASTRVNMVGLVDGLAAKGLALLSKRLAWLRLRGIGRQKAEGGTPSMREESQQTSSGTRSSARFAETPTSPQRPPEPDSAVAHARQPLYVVGVRPSGRRVPVYDLTVEHHHAYYANGVLVSNCDAGRYMAIVVTMAERRTRDRREPHSTDNARPPHTLDEHKAFVPPKAPGRGRIG
jgi:phage terminase large subunit